MSDTESTFTVPPRQGKRPQTGDSIPHLQFSQTSPPDIKQRLADWAFSALTGVREEKTRISVPSSRALWLDENIPPAHADAFMPPPGSREFAHLHADGSLHVHISDEAARELHAKAWGEPHPLNPREWLAYAPRDEEELGISKRIIRESYRYATGRLPSPRG